MLDSSTLDLCAALLESMPEPIVLCDTAHVVRYANPAGLAHYAKWGDIRGRSIAGCHKAESMVAIEAILAAFDAGETERCIADRPDKRIYMRAVRDAAGAVVGYYERYETVTAVVNTAA